MIEELIEVAVPGGAYMAMGVALGAAFSKQLRPLAKEALKVGMTVAAQAQELAAEAYEQGQDLMAEARHEYRQEARNGNSKVRPLPTNRRATRSRRGPASGAPTGEA